MSGSSSGQGAAGKFLKKRLEREIGPEPTVKRPDLILQTWLLTGEISGWQRRLKARQESSQTRSWKRCHYHAVSVFCCAFDPVCTWSIALLRTTYSLPPLLQMSCRQELGGLDKKDLVAMMIMARHEKVDMAQQMHHLRLNFQSAQREIDDYKEQVRSCAVCACMNNVERLDHSSHNGIR